MLFQNYFNDLGEHRLLHFIEVPGQDPLTKIEKKEEKNMTEEKKTEQKEKDESPDALLKHAKGQALERQQRAERMRMEFDDTNKETDDKAKRLAHIDTDMNAAKDATVVGMLGPDAHTKPDAPQPTVESVAVNAKAESKAETAENEVERKDQIAAESPDAGRGNTAARQVA
ncbi:hypothetical protein A3D88_00575 [Candidatus Peribacteria bacterium RIFCSPHIGHO2_02_FULL_52_16]|nr:MAG: hypothetical protein A2706_01350 [Candidatus Peribacteria bacterium RIFCSPHIGHO2_01_FULL_51_35]OGJ61967.1 MAG: hypothetical protein A3D88_00575 [Candidatus Peribacteria bacterium RIFCSPHIGHO2_02_FULL_52_16]